MKTLGMLGVAGLACAAGVLMAVAPSQAQTPPPAPADVRLHIVSATYGKVGSSHVRDFSDRLAQTCGDQSVTCESFCSKAQVGVGESWMHVPFTAHPVCRVIYRCGEGVTRAAETDGDELILLNCKQEH